MFLRPNLTVRPADHQAFADISILQVQSGHMRVVPSNDRFARRRRRAFLSSSFLCVNYGFAAAERGEIAVSTSSTEVAVVLPSNAS